MTAARPLYLLFGGTFDPIHRGHLASLLELQQRLQPDAVRLLPAKAPPHRTEPGATPAERLAMVQAAVAGHPGLIADGRELRRDGPSYSRDTVAELRRELGADCALAWVLGSDAFAAFCSWHRWRQLLELAHLIVLARPGSELPTAGAEADLLQRRRLHDPQQLRETPAGGILPLTLTPHPVSATAVRERLRAGELPWALLPEPVCRYIEHHHLYQQPGETQPNS